jgi:hypothetical protein
MIFGKRGETRTRNLGSGGTDLGFAIIDGQLTISSTSISPDKSIKNSDIYSSINLIASDIAACHLKYWVVRSLIYNTYSM